MLDRPSLNSRQIERLALKHWSTLRHMLFDFYGRPLSEVARLNPNYVPHDPARRRHNAPRLVELRGPSPYDGSWFCVGGTGATGVGIIAMVQYLGECDWRPAAEFLRDLTGRLAIVELR